ncbi:uncharacterized protein LOC144090782 [Stigmatopora argus]
MFPKGQPDGQKQEHPSALGPPPPPSAKPSSGPQRDVRRGSRESPSPARPNRRPVLESPVSAERDTVGPPHLMAPVRIEEDEGDKEKSSNHLVDHILKELKGINNIQEEISDLKHYLTSVRGSVDQVSCCVDAVLTEIGELYCGASAAPPCHPATPMARSSRRGSLGRQNAVTSPVQSVLPDASSEHLISPESHFASEHLWSHPPPPSPRLKRRNGGAGKDEKDSASVCSSPRRCACDRTDHCPNAKDGPPCSPLPDRRGGDAGPRWPRDDRSSSGDTLQMGSAESLDGDWTDGGIAGEGESAWRLCPSPAIGFDVATLGKAAQSPWPSPCPSPCPSPEWALTRSDSFHSEPWEVTSQSSADLTWHRDGVATEWPIAPPRAESPNMDGAPPGPTRGIGEPSSDDKDRALAAAWQHVQAPSTPRDIFSSKEGGTTLEMASPHRGTRGQVPSDTMPGDDVAEKTAEASDCGHRARIAHFQRILREKRQSEQRPSQSTTASQGSCASQSSERALSLETYAKETIREENKVAPIS